MATIELLGIDLGAWRNGTPAATLRFRIASGDAKADIGLFELDITVPRQGSLDDAVDRGFRAIHRLALELEEKLRPGGQPRTHQS